MLVFLYHAVKVGATSKRTPLQPLSQNILSKYLVQFVPETPRPAVKQSANRVFGQRVLTSSQGYKILADKEAKKQEELRDKEQKKAERLENKRRKEIERQRKAEERKAKKSAKSKPKKHSSKTKKNGSSQSGSSSSGDATQESQDTCCECSRTYDQDVTEGTGAEWVECACGKWLHEECIQQVEYDKNGQEKLCSSCTSVP